MNATQPRTVVLNATQPPTVVLNVTQPPTVVCKMEAQSEYVHIAYAFFARSAPTCMLSNKISAQKEGY